MRFNNFDTIRLIAAISVIFSHSFLMADLHEGNEPLVKLLGPHHIIGIYGVFVFLIISGFLVSQSLEKSTSLMHFIWKRFLRIYPALAVCAVVCALVIAPFFSNLGAKDFLLTMLGEKYVLKVVALMDPYSIPTVAFFDDGGWIANGVNGQLWTITQEIFCYLLIAFAALVGLFTIQFAIAAFLLSVIVNELLLERLTQGLLSQFLYLLPSFLSGVTLYFVHKRLKLSAPIAVACLAGLLIAAYLGYLRTVFPIFGSYVVVYLGLAPWQIVKATRLGDLSYGTYLYGWTTGEVVRHALGNAVTPWRVFAISLLLSLLCALVSWHLVEKRALRLKAIWPTPRLTHSSHGIGDSV